MIFLRTKSLVIGFGLSIQHNEIKISDVNFWVIVKTNNIFFAYIITINFRFKFIPSTLPLCWYCGIIRHRLQDILLYSNEVLKYKRNNELKSVQLWNFHSTWCQAMPFLKVYCIQYDLTKHIIFYNYIMVAVNTILNIRIQNK